MIKTHNLGYNVCNNVHKYSFNDGDVFRDIFFESVPATGCVLYYLRSVYEYSNGKCYSYNVMDENTKQDIVNEINEKINGKLNFDDSGEIFYICDMFNGEIM